MERPPDPRRRDDRRPTRRQLLYGAGSAAAAGLAGCAEPRAEAVTYDRTQAEFDPPILPYDETYPDDEGVTMFRGGLRRLGYYPDASVPDSVEKNWAMPVNDFGWTAAKASPQPTPDGGHLLIPGDTGKVHKVTADGKHRWTFQTGATSIGIHGTPAIAHGTAYVGGYDGVLYAIDVETGEEVWRTTREQLEGSIAIGSSPAYWDGVIYVVAEYNYPAAGTMWAVDAETGVPLWSDDRPMGMPHPTTAIDPEHERMLTASNDGVCYCWEFPSLEPAWTFETGAEIKCPIATYDGSAFFTSYDHHVYRVALKDGEEEWRFETGDFTKAAPAIDPDADVVYAGSSDGFVYALEAGSGEELWSQPVYGQVIGALSVTPETVLVGSYDSHLYAFDSTTGERRWRVENNGHVTSAPVPHDGRIYYAERAMLSNYWDDAETVVDVPGHAYCLVPDE